MPPVSLIRAIAISLSLGIGISVAPKLQAQSTLIPLTTRRDMVFDHAGKYLYITTSDGWVRPYNLSTSQLESGYHPGGSLNGADITLDDSFLLVTQAYTSGSQGMLHKLNLNTGSIVDITYPLDTWSNQEGGGWDVAIGPNASAFLTTQFNGSGWIPLRQIDLNTNVVTQVSGAPGSGPDGRVTQDTQIHRSADRTRFYFLEGNIDTGPIFTYNTITGAFGSSAKCYSFLAGAGGAVNRDGTLVATVLGLGFSPSALHVSLDSAPDFHFVRSFHGLDSGVAFDPATDIIYGVNSSADQIIAYNTNTFAEEFRLNIGESVNKAVVPFDNGTLVVSSDGRYLALATPSGIRLFTISAGTAVPTPPPTLTTRRDMVFDHSSRFLYVTTSVGLVHRYNIATGAVDATYDLGGSLNGLDISPDDSSLLVAQNDKGLTQGVFQKLDLSNDWVTNIPYARYGRESGGWEVAIGSNGLALVTTQYGDGAGDTGTSLMRQIDLTTNVATVRSDVPTFGVTTSLINQNTQVHRSADRTRMYFLQANESDGPIFLYNATSNSFSSFAQTDEFSDYASAAVNRNGSLLGTRLTTNATLDTAPNLSFLHSFNGLDLGVAFDAISDTFYGVNSVTDEIIAYDTNTYQEKFRLAIGDDVAPPYQHTIQSETTQFNTGSLVASQDGRYLAIETTTGIRIFSVPPTSNNISTPVFAEPRDMVFDHSGHYLYISTATGLVWPYNLLNNTLESPYTLGGNLNGIDISADDSFLFVAQGSKGVSEGAFQKLDLNTAAVTNLKYPLRPSTGFSEGIAWDVAISSSGLAFGTTYGYTFMQLHQIDPATNSVTVRTDVPSSAGTLPLIGGGAQIQRSADRTRLYFLEPNSSSGSIFTYSGTTNTFGPKIDTNTFLDFASAGVNRNGTLLGTRFSNSGASLETAPDFNFVHSFNTIDFGIAFDAVQDLLYGINTTTDQIIAYDTNTFAEKFRLAIGEDIAPLVQSPITTGQFNIGNMVASQDGHYLALKTSSTVRVINVTTGTSVPVSTPIPRPAGIGNISTRAFVQTGDNVAIAGFIITGTSPKKVVIRALGPSMTFTGHIQDPTLELHDNTGAVVAFNDNWKDSQQGPLELLHLAPGVDQEAAMVQILSPGAYTAIMRGKNDTTGISLLEVYDVDPNSNSKLSNISTRSAVGTGNNIMIGGVIIAKPVGSGANSQKVLIRGIGPSLTQFNVPNALQDPTLELHDGNGAIIASNDNWKDTQQSSIQATGFAPKDNRESAILATFTPGNYTAILRGKNDTIGVALIEIYRMQ